MKIITSILYVFAILCLLDPNDSLAQQSTERDLFQYKKELLVSEVNWLAQSAVETQKHRWQLRLVWATFSAAFLGLSVSSKDFRKLKLGPRWYPIVVTFFLFFLFFLYDCHFTDMIDSSSDRYRKIAHELNELPNKHSLDELKAIEVFVDTRKDYKNKSWYTRPWIKLAAAKKLDFLLFYLFTALMWVAGWRITFSN